MIIGCLTDVGQKRQLNEDATITVKLDLRYQGFSQEAGLFVVCDGMGGHNAGEIASEMGVKVFASEFIKQLLAVKTTGSNEDDQQDSPVNIQEMLGIALKTANQAIFSFSEADKESEGMGATIIAALITGDDIYVTQAGDSRCYIINSRETQQIGKDHSLVQELVDAGMLKQEEARFHPKKNVLSRVLGYYNDVEADTYHSKLYDGDCILLCSDGLWDMLGDSEITSTVVTAPTPQKACEQLVADANESGGPDNITVIVIKPEGLLSWQDTLVTHTQVKKRQHAPQAN